MANRKRAPPKTKQHVARPSLLKPRRVDMVDGIMEGHCAALEWKEKIGNMNIRRNHERKKMAHTHN